MVEVIVVALVTVLTLAGAYKAQSRRRPDSQPAIDLLNRVDVAEIKRRAEAIEKRSWT